MDARSEPHQLRRSCVAIDPGIAFDAACLRDMAFELV
jgi:hypothetical protein